MRDLLRLPAANPKLWLLDPKVTFLNHGSFGACPKAVLAFQNSIRTRMEREPIQFLVRELERLLDAARKKMADFVGADPDGLVFVNNATSGVNTVLRSLRFTRGDELLVTNHEYNACRNALEMAAKSSGAKIVVVHIPFPFTKQNEIVRPILEAITPRTRLLLIDHVTSQTGVVMPLEKILRETRKRGIEVLVDGAHGAGMIPINLQKLKPTYYTGNCHKWLCAPKTAAFLYVDPSRRNDVHPLAISHGINSPRKDRSRFLIEFGWMGTSDPSPVLSVPTSIDYIEQLLPGGWPAVMERNRSLALAGRAVLCETLEIEPPCPDEFIGSLASVPLPDGESTIQSKSPLYLDSLQNHLMERGKIEVPVIPWPAAPKRLLRISAQLYNSLPDYEFLAGELKKELR